MGSPPALPRKVFNPFPIVASVCIWGRLEPRVCSTSRQPRSTSQHFTVTLIYSLSISLTASLASRPSHPVTGAPGQTAGRFCRAAKASGWAPSWPRQKPSIPYLRAAFRTARGRQLPLTSPLSHCGGHPAAAEPGSLPLRQPEFQMGTG
jgi:hypothetical protein